MLTPTSAATVRATLPAVGAAIDDITRRFYQRLFTAHPELSARMFNAGNQAKGDQQRALAGSVAGFATLLLEHPDERPDAALERLLGRIAHKHVSLGVAEEQYPVVHEHLMGAIVEVLGDAVTPQVAAAWDEVYWLMAHALIAIERRLYQQAGATPGDGVWSDWTVAARTRETDGVASFELVPASGAPAPAFRPGQYVSVAVELPGGRRQIRQYSLSCRPGSATRRITVKREDLPDRPAGEVSNWLHANVRAGDTLTLGVPCGDVVLEDGPAPLLLVTAGIGITPAIGMLEHLAATGDPRPVRALHADRSVEDHALREDLYKLVGGLPEATVEVWYERASDDHPADRTGLMDLTDVDIPHGARAYLCGPMPFMRAARTQLIGRGVAAADIHYEVFGPDLLDAA